MTSARMLLATVALGLAACAYTPNKDALYLPDIDAAAPVLMVNADVPPGYNDHVVIIVDHAGLARAESSGYTEASRPRHYIASGYYSYPHYYPTSRPSGSPVGGTTSQPGVPQVSRPAGARVSGASRDTSPRRGSARATR